MKSKDFFKFFNFINFYDKFLTLDKLGTFLINFGLLFVSLGSASETSGLIIQKNKIHIPKVKFNFVYNLRSKYIPKFGEGYYHIYLLDIWVLRGQKRDMNWWCTILSFILF